MCLLRGNDALLGMSPKRPGSGRTLHTGCGRPGTTRWASFSEAGAAWSAVSAESRGSPALQQGRDGTVAGVPAGLQPLWRAAWGGEPAGAAVPLWVWTEDATPGRRRREVGLSLHRAFLVLDHRL